VGVGGNNILDNNIRCRRSAACIGLFQLLIEFLKVKSTHLRIQSKRIKT